MALSALYTALELMMGREKPHNICTEQTRVSVNTDTAMIWVTLVIFGGGMASLQAISMLCFV